jgi:hypothetical protein
MMFARLRPNDIRQWLAARAATTPGRLTLYMVVIGLLAALAGLAAVVGTSQRASLVGSVAGRSGPQVVQTQQLYRSLSDADATAASAFLSSGVEPPALRERYLADIAAASDALAAAAQTSHSDVIARLAADLPVYTGLVETARTYNRLNLPLAGAYLREASGLMRERLLPAAQELYTQQAQLLDADRSGASGLPWLAILLLLATLAGLAVAQLYLIRRTRRLVNVGLAAATGAALLALIWVGASWIGVSVNLAASHRDGSEQVAVVAQARIAALQARADEALTLVARGSGASFEKDFGTNMTELTSSLEQARSGATSPAVRDALAQAKSTVEQWRTAHQNLRKLDDTGQYPEAVTIAVGSGDASAASLFNRVDAALATAIADANTTFTDRAEGADNALTGAAVGLTLLTLVVLAGLVVGLQTRIGEYR